MGPSRSDPSRKLDGKVRSLIDAAASLRCKATGLVVILTLSVTAVVSGYLLRSSEQFARRERGTQIVQVAAILAKAAAHTLAAGDLDALQVLAEDAANREPLLYVIFSDVQGRQLAAAERPHTHILQRLRGDSAARAPVPGQPVFRDGTDQVPVFLDVMYPITIRTGGPGESTQIIKRKLLGYVRAAAVADAWHRTMASRLDLLIGVGVLAAVAAIPLGFLLVRRIVAPLDGLADGMHRFSQGELHVRSHVNRRDEIGRLARAFNRMADQHQHTHERIVRLNAELEQRVAQRTQQLRELASREPLTGLYNRRYFNEMLEHRFAEAVRYGSDLSCVMIDLDGFKAVNDAFGHHVGDEMLITAAHTIRGQLRSADVAARFGGDEFIILLPQTDTDRALVLAERIAEQFAHEVSARLSRVRVTMSMGIASVPAPGLTSAESLIRASDDAMYDAKAAGKNRIVVAGLASKPTLI